MSAISPLDKLLVERIKINAEIEIKGNNLENWLPHRGIALCLDGVEYEEELHPNQIKGFWTPDERYCDGHFDVNCQIIPGHWLDESVVLVGGILAQLALPGFRGMLPLRESMSVTSISPVVPGIKLIHKVFLEKADGRSVSFYFETIRLSGKTTAVGSFSGKAVPKDLLFKMLRRHLNSL